MAHPKKGVGLSAISKNKQAFLPAVVLLAYFYFLLLSLALHTQLAKSFLKRWFTSIRIKNAAIPYRKLSQNEKKVVSLYVKIRFYHF
jgi:hypothetical protein